MHYKVSFIAFDLANRAVLTAFDLEDYCCAEGTTETLKDRLTEWITEVQECRRQNTVTIIGDNDNPTQVRVTGFDSNGDLGIITATHVDAARVSF